MVGINRKKLARLGLTYMCGGSSFDYRRRLVRFQYKGILSDKSEIFKNTKGRVT